jgi:hypothetical protein
MTLNITPKSSHIERGEGWAVTENMDDLSLEVKEENYESI